MLARNVEYLMTANGARYPFNGIDLQNEFPNAAIIGNFESSIAVKHVQTPAYGMQFSTNSHFVESLKNAGFSLLSLANNHSADYGQAGYYNAVKTLLDAELDTVGCGKALACDEIRYLEVNAGTVAIIAVTGLESGVETRAKTLLRTAAKQSDFQIVYIHWGEEYQLFHSERQFRIAKSMVEAGADLIVGHHPHVVQDIQLIDGVPVFYSLGNYIFDQYFSNDVQEGLIIEIVFGKEPKARLLPVESLSKKSQPNFITGDDKAGFLYELSKRSAPELQTAVSHGELSLVTTFASSPKMAMINK